MIVDNIDDDASGISRASEKDLSNSIAKLLPESENGSILFTSRNLDVARRLTGRDKDVISVTSMNKREAARLLETKLIGSTGEGEDELLAALDYIPLAITQAAAYINRLPSMTTSRYLQDIRYTEGKTRLLGKAHADSRRDQKATNSVLTTWQMSFEYIRSEKPSAADLMSYMSYFNRNGIPKFMMKHYLDKNTSMSLDEKEQQFEEDIATLSGFSFISPDSQDDEYRMHGLVQFATRLWLEASDVKSEGEWWRKFVSSMAFEFPVGDLKDWKKCHTLFPHVESMVNRLPNPGSERKDWRTVLYNAAWYALEQGLLVRAESLIKKQIEESQKEFGEEGDQTLSSMRLYGDLLKKQGKYEASEEMYRKVLAVREREFGENDRKTLSSVRNLASVLVKQGKYEEAEGMARRALAGKEVILGESDKSTLAAATTLAVVLRNLGNYDEAEKLNRRALEGCTKLFGTMHVDSLTAMETLAVTLIYQGKLEEAEQMTRTALAGLEKLFGDNHRSTLRCADNLASVLSRQHKFEEAEEKCRRALVGMQRVLGEEHHDTLFTMANLRSILEDLGKDDDAENMNLRALKGMEKALGVQHPHTLKAMRNQARFVANRGCYSESIELYERACAGLDKAYGPDHPQAVGCRRDFAAVRRRAEGRESHATTRNRGASRGQNSRTKSSPRRDRITRMDEAPASSQASMISEAEEPFLHHRPKSDKSISFRLSHMFSKVSLGKPDR